MVDFLELIYYNDIVELKKRGDKTESKNRQTKVRQSEVG